MEDLPRCGCPIAPVLHLTVISIINATAVHSSAFLFRDTVHMHSSPLFALSEYCSTLGVFDTRSHTRTHTHTHTHTHTQPLPEAPHRSCRLGLHVRSLFLGPSVDDIGTSVLITSPPEVVGRLTLVLDIRRTVRLATAADLGKVCVCRV